MDRFLSEFKRITEEAGFRAGIADKTGTVLYCPEETGLSQGDAIPAEGFAEIDLDPGQGEEYIIFAPRGTDTYSSDTALSALKLLRTCLTTARPEGISVSVIFAGALEGSIPNAGKQLEHILPELESGTEYRLLTACCTGEDAGDTGKDQLKQIGEVAAELFPEDHGYITAVFKNGAKGYVSTLIRTPVKSEEDVSPAEDYAMQLLDTAIAETMLDVRVAVSGGFTYPERIGKMALQTLEMLRLGEKFGIRNRCLVYEKLGLERLISSASEEDRLEYLRSVLGGQQWTDKSMQELLNTVSVFLQCNQNSSITAKRMYVHRNTVNNRIEKFGKLTGLDCTSFTDGVRVRIALLIIRYMGQGDAEDAPVD